MLTGFTDTKLLLSWFLPSLCQLSHDPISVGRWSGLSALPIRGCRHKPCWSTEREWGGSGSKCCPSRACTMMSIGLHSGTTVKDLSVQPGYPWKSAILEDFLPCHCLRLYPSQRAAVSLPSLVPFLCEISKMEEFFEGPPVSHNPYTEIHLPAYRISSPTRIDCSSYHDSSSTILKVSSVSHMHDKALAAIHN